MTSVVSRVTAAPSSQALAHFRTLLQFETDCWDVHFAISNNRQDFVLVDVRSELLFGQSHIEQAINIPHKKLTEDNLKAYPTDTLFVVYCAGPHCNGTEKGAIKLAELGRPVKKMIGGITGWIDEGLPLVAANPP
ncbi:rhodanese-like domain-containing protein [Paraglaciecola arctica]|uniref:rhodanese-like domain-containing protein n=1 Tax=Paraglaciecola arctica TaxID=1128911 RepID=UPI001C07AB51|nr:rhodanese-like domain-containing protein [Paraglaciecola arctica]MBU3005667.1 rhodanese-like domain-containing protein [Paraglaciecola arctica]